MNQRVLVIGGGVVGMLAAARHRDAGDDVVLVDSARLGGLLRSEEVFPGAWVDHGTHVPQETGDEALDDFLFGGLPDHGWVRHDRLLPGNAFRGQLDGRTPFPDLNRFDGDLRAQLERGLLACGAPCLDPRTAAEELDALFGEPVRRAVFDPLLRKWYGVDAGSVGAGAHRMAANRVVAFTPERTAELKAARPELSVAWHDASIDASPLKAHYAVEGGAGAWIDHLRTKLDGVEILEETRLSLRAVGDRIAIASSDGGADLAIDQVVSTVPPAVLLMMLGRPPTGSRPRFVETNLVDLVVDQPFATDLHYFTILDPEPLSFRITLYPNLRGRPDTGPFVLTAEVLGELGGAELAGPDVAGRIHRELVELGVIVPDATVLHRGGRSLPAGFPVPVAGAPARPMTDPLEGLDNVTSLGRAAGGAFFLRDVLLDAHRRLPDVA